MNEQPKIIHHFAGRRPALLIVLDGWGLGNGGASDAISQANTPNFHRLWNNFPHTTLLTHGHFVGLPNLKDLGGSEVGHLTMGAGKLLVQGPTRISRAIHDGSFYQQPALTTVINHALNHRSTLHLLGLLSDGNVHSHIDHILALVNHADRSGIKRLRLHALLDGRDVAIKSADRYVSQIEETFCQINANPERDYCIASGGGRETTTMDRDNNWERVARGWQAHVHGTAQFRFDNAQSAIAFFRQANPNLIDQDMPAFVIVDERGEPVGTIEEQDSVINVNFRGDRAIEITEAFCLDDFSGFDRGRRPHICYAGMMVYDEDRDLPHLQIFGPTSVANPLGRRLVNLGIRQFRLTETQKFPHVTFFFNGGYRQPLDSALEDYILIPSDKLDSFAAQPAMKAMEISAKAVALIESGNYGFGLINFANADMVGHCGDMAAAIAAVEWVDRALAPILAALERCGGSALITADHGNADEMLGNKQEPATKHSINPVPCLLFDSRFDGSYTLRQPTANSEAPAQPGLYNLAATIFEMLGLEAPEDMLPSLIEPLSTCN